MRVLWQTQDKITYQCNKCGEEVTQDVQELLDEIAEREAENEKETKS